MAEYIEREATLSLLRSLGNRDYRREKGTIQDAIKMISFAEYTPAADVAPVVHGRWEKIQSVYGINKVEVCSNCGDWVPLQIEPYKYCPNCGARMDGTELYD